MSIQSQDVKCQANAVRVFHERVFYWQENELMDFLELFCNPPSAVPV